jgi:hypothetical protein
MAAVTRGYLGPSGVIIAALLVALVIFDTTLVTVSRSRAGRSVLTGGRDHLTHRVAGHVGAPRRVALTLAGTQLLLCGVTIGVSEAGVGWVLLAGGMCTVVAIVMIWQLDRAFEHPVMDTASQAAESLEVGAPAGTLDSVGRGLGKGVPEFASPDVGT